MPEKVSVSWLVLGLFLQLQALPGHGYERVISLAPHLTELMYELKLDDRLVGTVEYSDYPLQANRLPSVGNAAGIQLEALLALQPDLVLAWPLGNSPVDLDALKKLNLEVVEFSPRTLEQIPADMERLGALFGDDSIAKERAASFRTRLESMRFSGHSDEGSAPEVFYQIWFDPLMTQNGTTLISQIIEWCGGVNPFAELAVLAPIISKEAVIASDPDWLMTGYAGHKALWGKPALAYGLDIWNGTPLTAVKEQRLAAIPSDWLHRPTSRMLNGVEAICELLQSDERIP